MEIVCKEEKVKALYNVGFGRVISWDGKYYIVTSSFDERTVTCVDLSGGRVQRISDDSMVTVVDAEFVIK